MNSCLYYDELFSIMHSIGDTAIRKAEAFLSLSQVYSLFSLFFVYHAKFTIFCNVYVQP